MKQAEQADIYVHALSRRRALTALAGTAALVLAGCTDTGGADGSQGSTSGSATESVTVIYDDEVDETEADVAEPAEEETATEEAAVEETAEEEVAATPEELYAALDISEDYRSQFVHGEKGAEYQKYIVLHDTEGSSDAASVVSWWAGNGNLIAAHFVVNKDGSMVQCVELDKIAHHAGFGNTGHNEKFGVEDESRDDKLGTTSIGSSYADYGMNSYSIGIELVHVGGSGDYPEAQLEALDALIAYIDAYYGFESQIIDHKTWRTTNSDTSAEFADYLANYQDHRSYA